MNSTNSKFDLDLKFGQAGEEWVKMFGRNCTMEVKTERDEWYRTGNIFVEYESRGKPSGLAVTESDLWTVPLSLGGQFHGALTFRTDLFKRNLRRFYRDKTVRMATGGDDHTSKGLLLPIRMVREMFMLD